jgi:hexokinase
MQIQELTEVRDNFLREMQQSSKGQKTSLPFIKHILSGKPVVTEGNQFQVIIIGGSIFRSAIFKKSESGLEIVEQSRGNLPIFNSKETFLSFVEQQLQPSISVLSINFAYPLLPVSHKNILDGELVWGSKEHTFEGLIGEKVGSTIAEYVKRKMGRDITVSIANDTICLLLSGLGENTWNQTSCGIVGTGLNFAFFIDQHTAVNLETAGFDKFTVSESTQELDKMSVSPGSALLEKECSGAYLYQKYNIMIASQNIDTEPLNATDELDIIAADENHPGNGVAKELVERSAQLTAMQISGIMEYHQQNINFVMAGSLFWKAVDYKENVERYIKQLSPNFTATFTKNENAELYGAARLVS